MSLDFTPQPSVMPLDRQSWKRELHLSNFVNTYYQYRDVSESIGSSGHLLIVGPGVGLDALVMRWKGYNVTTFDIDETFSPDVLGSCHDMSMFTTGQFDAVVASHVLEHLPLHLLNCALSEIARVGRFAVIYLPVAGRHIQISLKPEFRGINFSFAMDLFPYWEKPSGNHLSYGGGQHYWEVGYRGFKVKNIEKRLNRYFKILRRYRNKDWLPSYNFILKSAI